MSVIFFGAIVLAVIASCITFCHIRHKRRIQKAQEKVYNDYLREQVIIQQGYLDAYSALLMVAEKQKRKAQNPAWSRW